MAVFLFIPTRKGNLGGTFINGAIGPRKGSDSKLPRGYPAHQLPALMLGGGQGEVCQNRVQSLWTNTLPDHSDWA